MPVKAVIGGTRPLRRTSPLIAPRAFDAPVRGASILPTFGPASPGEPLTMSSREIAELLGVRHDNAMRAIDRLTSRSTISIPPMEEYKDTNGVRRYEYLLDKRSSLIVVAQLSPEFTARVVDRWQELEAQVSQPPAPQFAIPQTLPESVIAVVALDKHYRKLDRCGGATKKSLRRADLPEGSV